MGCSGELTFESSNPNSLNEEDGVQYDGGRWEGWGGWLEGEKQERAASVGSTNVVLWQMRTHSIEAEASSDVRGFRRQPDAVYKRRPCG
jgi:hypothetical protein